MRLKKRRSPLAYLPMRALAFSLICLLSIVDLAWSQTVTLRLFTGDQSADDRPILLGKGPNSLIDHRPATAGLIKKGQKDALIMFNCAVRKDGGVEWSATYSGTPGRIFSSRNAEENLACV